MQKPIFSTAFYWALRDTLVSKDLDTATHVAFKSGPKRFRVVTLKGELIDPSGAMSGGGNKVRGPSLAALMLMLIPLISVSLIHVCVIGPARRHVLLATGGGV